MSEMKRKPHFFIWFTLHKRLQTGVFRKTKDFGTKRSECTIFHYKNI